MKKTLIAFTLLACQQVQAHAGHDHSHWLSSSIHVLTAIAIASIVFAGYKMVKGHKAKKVEEK